MTDDAARADGDSAESSEDELFGAGGKVDRDALYRLHDAREDDDAPVKVQFKLSRDLKKRLDRYLFLAVGNFERPERNVVAQ